ncbi:MAG: protein kinase [Burkholderiales bacterium]|jgi:tRNA A-37 threonylcarbamoyl transferase component Bud32
MKELTPGLELGARFVLVRRIGRGGSAEVWLAVDRERGERVALKFFDEALAGDAVRRARLEAEVAQAKTLPAGFTVAVHGLEQLEGRTCLVMEFLEGGDLGQLRGRSFESWSQAVDDVAVALEALHARGLVHRDLKCANVFLDAAGRAKLGDFGLTALAGSSSAGGSPYNASPQQLRGEPAQPADDLYAFGALLYELISGHPPYYPEITRERVLHEPVPPLLPRGAVPAGVRELALRLLSKSPNERPGSATIARAKLAVAATDEGGALKPLAHAAPAPAAAARARSARILPLALGVVAVIAVAAIFMMPARKAANDSGFAAKARQEAEQESEAKRKAALAQVAQQASRASAETERDAFNAAFKSLDARAAARWATAEFAKARESGDHAAQRYAVGDYLAATQDWHDGSATLAALDKAVPNALADAVKRGADALDAAKTGAAREAYQLALAIEPKHPPAIAGLARADRLDAALAAADAARRDEEAGRAASAEAGYRKALSIDSSVPGAQEGLNRLAASQAADAYSVAMSRGFADAAAGRNDAARAAFNQALALRPGAREAKDALASLDQGQRASALNLLEARARTAESGERWDEALTAWREAASLEPSLESARDGLTRATPRAELQRSIDALIAKPERLWDPAGRAEARGLLATAASAGNPRERLSASARDLERLAAAAQSPVRLRLESDGLTQVVIYRVGQYGTFSTRDVELLPGRYTVVGTRTGFRDVRREVLLPPGTVPAAVVVRCEEPI